MNLELLKKAELLDCFVNIYSL